MSNTNPSKELYELYVCRFGECKSTPYQAEYYKRWLDLLDSCSSNEEAEEKSKENGLYAAGASAVALDRVNANKLSAQELGWTDVAEFCDDMIRKIKADPNYIFTHSSLWSDLQARKNRWLETIEGFHRLFVDFQEYDDTRSDPQRAMSNIADDLKMLSKPSADFATLAAIPSFRALIDCSDEYYKVFTDIVGKASATGHLDAIQWNTQHFQGEIEELWDNRDALMKECCHWYNQEVKSPSIRLSPESSDGKYELMDID